MTSNVDDSEPKIFSNSPDPETVLGNITEPITITTAATSTLINSPQRTSSRIRDKSLQKTLLPLPPAPASVSSQTDSAKNASRPKKRKEIENNPYKMKLLLKEVEKNIKKRKKERKEKKSKKHKKDKK